MNTAKALIPGRNVWDKVRADDSRVIVDAAAYYRAFYAAALRAEQYILISGWQFDRGVKLLRGPTAVGRKIRLVQFLDDLCRRKPHLHIFILAWDFHVVFALEREWMQRLWFHYATHERLTFRFDDAVADQGSHHQKFVVIDGRDTFLGGIDLCESRWDDREHRTVNPLRRSRGRQQKPYHDMQAHLQGRVVGAKLRDLFVERWARSGGDPLQLKEIEHAVPIAPSADPASSIRLGPAVVGLSRTDPIPADGLVKEVEHLFVDAIGAARRIIYIETQYFSSTRIRDALLARMQDATMPRLQIVGIVNPRAEALKEEIAVGLRQAKNIQLLRAVAGQTGQALGFFYSLSDGPGKRQQATYIHSKMMAVDDRFLTVGSANLTNRSMEVDSELHVSWDAEQPGDRISRGIRRMRVSLLAEHTGLGGVANVRGFVRVENLVARLEALCERPDARLRRCEPPTEAQKTLMAVVDPEDLPFDPAPSLQSKAAQ